MYHHHHHIIIANTTTIHHHSSRPNRWIHYSFADDEPDEEGSPQHYVLIHGFLSASILQHLANIGVQVNAIIKLQQDEYRTIPPADLTEETQEDVEAEVIEPEN
jgi:hypothetical protein